MTAREIDCSQFNPPPLETSERLRRLRMQRDALTASPTTPELERMLEYVDRQIQKYEAVLKSEAKP